MSEPHSDALVFFGATGDLAYKKIFPSLQTLVKRGRLDVPVVGVANAGWTLEQLRARALERLKEHGGGDAAAFERLSGLLRYVDGDYKDPATFQVVVVQEQQERRRPPHRVHQRGASRPAMVRRSNAQSDASNARHSRELTPAQT